MEDAQIITQERVQNRTVKQKLFTASQLRLNTLKWNVFVERVVEQSIDVQKSQVMEKIVKFPKITQHVEDTQYRQSAVGENLKTVSANREPSGGEAAQNLQDDDAQKAFSRTGKVLGEQNKSKMQ